MARKQWTSIYLTAATKARLEEYRRRLERQVHEGRLVLPFSEQPGADRLTSDYLLNRLLDRVEDGMRGKRRRVDPADHGERCVGCNGVGSRLKIPLGGAIPDWADCPVCGGTGVC